MSTKMKILLAVLGAAAAMNAGADLWFRLAVSSSTHAPWYVWAPVIATVAVVMVTGLAGWILKHRQREAEDAATSPIIPIMIEHIADRDDEAEARRLILSTLSANTIGARGGTIAFLTRAYMTDGRVRFTASCLAGS